MINYRVLNFSTYKDSNKSRAKQIYLLLSPQQHQIYSKCIICLMISISDQVGTSPDLNRHRRSAMPDPCQMDVTEYVGLAGWRYANRLESACGAGYFTMIFDAAVAVRAMYIPPGTLMIPCIAPLAIMRPSMPYISVGWSDFM